METKSYEDASAIEIVRKIEREVRDRLYTLERDVAMLTSMFEIVARKESENK